MANNTNTSWERIQQGVSDTERLIGQKEYNASMIKARQTLEFMVKLLSERAGLDDGCDLKTQIDLLYQNRWISKSACEHYHKIRIIGNGGTAHGQTIACRSNSLPTLEDRIPRGNEQDNIKAQIFSRLFGTSQMPVMDRIEGATHDP